MAELTGHREESFKAELLDLSDNVVGDLPGALDDLGTLDFSVYATIRGSGNLSVLDAGVDWLAHRVRVSYVTGGTTSPLITGIPRAPLKRHTALGTTLDVELYDKTSILSEDSYGVSYGLAAGTQIIPAVADVIASTGEPASSTVLAESAATLAAGMVWEAGVSKLKIINDLLSAAGYFAIYCDGLGRLRADPYTTPSSRPVEWDFEDGLYLPTWTDDLDVFSVPNRYVCVGRTEGGVAALTSTATDVSTGPYSYSSRGRWVTRTDTDVEAASQTVLDLIAQRRLFEAQQTTRTFEFTHPWLPFGPNSVVQFGGVRAAVGKQSDRLSVGGLVTSTARGLS